MCYANFIYRLALHFSKTWNTLFYYSENAVRLMNYKHLSPEWCILYTSAIQLFELFDWRLRMWQFCLAANFIKSYIYELLLSMALDNYCCNTTFQDRMIFYWTSCVTDLKVHFEKCWNPTMMSAEQLGNWRPWPYFFKLVWGSCGLQSASDKTELAIKIL